MQFLRGQLLSSPSEIVGRFIIESVINMLDFSKNSIILLVLSQAGWFKMLFNDWSISTA